jgi:hypothetical protein
MLWIKILIVFTIAATAFSARAEDQVSETTHAFQAAVAAGESEAPCVEIIGQPAAEVLVRHCMRYTAATHPPCNTTNSCALIVHEIRRSCLPTADADLPCSQ